MKVSQPSSRGIPQARRSQTPAQGRVSEMPELSWSSGLWKKLCCPALSRGRLVSDDTGHPLYVGIYLATNHPQCMGSFLWLRWVPAFVGLRSR